MKKSINSNITVSGIKSSKKILQLVSDIPLKTLNELGFTKAESEIYIYLLKRGGEVGVSKIAIGTKMHRQQVYLTLPNLLETGLVEEVKDTSVAKYRARPPQHLERIARGKLLKAEHLAKELQKISKIGNEQDFEVIIGEESFRSYEIERARALPIGSSQYIIGVKSDKYMYITQSIQDEYAKILKERGIKTYYLGSEEADEVYNSIEYHFERRKLTVMNLKYMSTVISDGRFSFYSNLEPVSAYVIHSEKIADDYKDFFMMLWDMAGNREEMNTSKGE